MRSCLLLLIGSLLIAGCQESAPPPVDPVPAGVELPPGMPNDNWFYENVLTSKVPVLVDFNATWCGPCQKMKPAIKAIGETYGERIKVVEIDIDEHPFLSDHFSISGIPHLMVILEGKIRDQAIGLQSYSKIVSLLLPTAGRP